MISADAFYRVVEGRRDIREGFLPDPVADDVLTRILAAAHRGPSVGLTQPWDFLIIRDAGRRRAVQVLAERQRQIYEATLTRPRAQRFDRLKIEAILEAPVNVVVTCDPTRGGRNPLGRHSQPQMAAYSVACAVQNLWLAARAEEIGVGWVSFFDERELAAELGLPDHLQIVAYLCVGHVAEFPPAPQLALTGWARRRPLSWAVHNETYGNRGLPGEESMNLIDETIAAIRPLDEAAMRAAAEHQARLTKPPGSLGVLEELSIRLAGLAGECPPPMPEPAAIAIFAADHGVHAQGVTPWPQEVTAQMVANFVAGGAVVNAFARQVGAEVTVVDIGVKGELPAAPGLLPRKVAHGTADMTEGPAMTLDQARLAVETGIEIARDLVAAGNRCLLTGDMGIANTTASAALISAFTGRDPADVTGHGTGIDTATHAHKIEVVRAALRRLPGVTLGTSGVGGSEASQSVDSGQVSESAGGMGSGASASGEPSGTYRGADSGHVSESARGMGSGDSGSGEVSESLETGVGVSVAGSEVLGVLAAVGGFEHAALAGFILGAAAERVPVVLDGVIAGAAALVAAALAPDCLGACVAGHRSIEPGHSAALDQLGLRPLVDLELRLGEGTGALLALPLVQSSVRVLYEVATFDSAGVTDKT